MKYIKTICACILFTSLSSSLFSQIIADHTVVAKYDEIPQQWIDSVKTKWAVVVGASHAEAYINGLDELEQVDAAYAYEDGAWEPLPYTNQYLRLDKWIWGDYQDPSGGWQNWSYNNSWWTHPTGTQLMRENLDRCSTLGLFAIWFGWSYDAIWLDVAGSYDPVYHTRWGGAAPRWENADRKIWGLDAGDAALTGNSLSMQNYIDTMNMYKQYVADNDLDIKIVYSTGAIDDNQGENPGFNKGELGYQAHLKWQYIRDYVATQGNDTYLIDYADILSYNDAGVQATTTWTDNSGVVQTFPIIHPENNTGVQSAHIGNVGALKIGKATWWLLARMAGWDGGDSGGDDTAPSVPANLQVNSASETAVSISWDASSDDTGVSGYNIFRNSVLIGSTSSLTYIDNSVDPCTSYSYQVSAYDASGNESNRSTVLEVSTCEPDITPTLIVTPNISHGVTLFDVIVRVTELNSANTHGVITVKIPVDDRWDIEGGFDTNLTLLDGFPLNNNNWSHTSDTENHVFTSSEQIPAGGYSTFGFTITFNPDTNRGLYTITTQLESGSGGESRDSNNADSERLDYFQ